MSFCNNARKILVNGRAVFKACGKCALCRNAFSNELSFRFRKDVEMWNEVYPELCRTFFLTLTYDEDHVPTVVDELNPDLKFNYLPGVHKTLRYEDLFKWKERIRSQLERTLKKDLEKYGLKRLPLMIVSSGEYGDETHRPHYHVVIHGIPCSYGSVADCWLLFSKKWCDEKGEQLGFVRSELVRTNRSVHYTTKYSAAGLDCCIPECCESPRVQYGKGIGNVYFSKKKDQLIANGGIIDSYYDSLRKKEVRIMRSLPKYFVRKYLKDHKNLKKHVYVKNIVSQLKGFVKQFGFTGSSHSFEEFAEASWNLKRLGCLKDKLNTYSGAIFYLSESVFTPKGWKEQVRLGRARGRFDFERIAKDPFLYNKMLCDSALENAISSTGLSLYVDAVSGECPGPCFCLSHVARVLRWSDARVFNVLKLLDAVFKQYVRMLDEYSREYAPFLDVYKKYCDYMAEASIQAQRDLEANGRKDKI